MSRFTLNVGMIETSSGINPDRIENPLELLLESMKEECDILLAPEWLFIKGEDTLYSEEEYEEILDKIMNASAGLDKLVVPGSIGWNDGGHYVNTAPVIYNGELIYRYDKRRDGGDSTYGTNCGVDWKKGNYPNHFKWKGLDIGIQICADHHNENIDEEVDVQLVVSYGGHFYVEKTQNLRLGGLFSKCDGFREVGTAAYQRVPSDFIADEIWHFEDIALRKLLAHSVSYFEEGKVSEFYCHNFLK